MKAKDKSRSVHNQWADFCFGKLLLATEEETRVKYVSRG